MSVGRLCIREVHLASGDEPVSAAAVRMLEHDVGTLLVLDERRRPVGIVTDRDLVLRVLAEGRPADTPVRAAMTPRPRVVGEGTPIEDALALMRAGGFRRLPVVDDAGALAGILTLDDVVAFLAAELGDVGRLLEGQSPEGGGGPGGA